MSEPIKRGDMAMLVWACCRDSRKFLGWTGVVDDIAESRSVCGACRNAYQGAHGLITVTHRGCVPLPWLKKIEPPQETQDECHNVEITA